MRVWGQGFERLGFKGLSVGVKGWSLGFKGFGIFCRGSRVSDAVPFSRLLPHGAVHDPGIRGIHAAIPAEGLDM